MPVQLYDSQLHPKVNALGSLQKVKRQPGTLPWKVHCLNLTRPFEEKPFCRDSIPSLTSAVEDIEHAYLAFRGADENLGQEHSEASEPLELVQWMEPHHLS
jgi:hypothetical protein